MSKKRSDDFFDKIASDWKRKMDQKKEYVFEDGDIRIETARTCSVIKNSEYGLVQQYKLKLLEEHSGNTLEDVFRGKEIQTIEGTAYLIEDQQEVLFLKPFREESLSRFNSELRLLRGIGPVMEKKLKARGCKTIKDLINHPRFGEDARQFLDELERKDLKAINERIARFYSRSDPLAFHAAGFQDVEDFLFFDIETLGLSFQPIILFGIARMEGKYIKTRQFLVRDIPEEPADIIATVENIDENTAIVSYNGRSFDIPYLSQRLNYYCLNAELRVHQHFDLLHFSRRAWKDVLPNHSLSTLETHLLGLEREIDLPSSMVPEFYETYLNENNPGPLIPIIEHNKQDLVSLASIFTKLKEWAE
ncbi:MAG: ribonuclease H-like domain-containing protein [Candidatus Helarchaeales archaeon]